MGLSGTLLDLLGRTPGTLSELTWATRYARTRGGQNPVFMRRRMVYVQVSGHSDGLGSAFCKAADAYGLRSGWGDRRVGLGVTMGARLARQGSAFTRLCWLLLHLDLRQRVSGQARGLVVAPLQARARSAAFDRPTSRHIQ